eukprot:1900468-Amphidinium_carterae.1
MICRVLAQGLAQCASSGPTGSCRYSTLFHSNMSLPCNNHQLVPLAWTSFSEQLSYQNVTLECSKCKSKQELRTSVQTTHQPIGIR